MTMPGARKLTVGDRTYSYLLKGERPRLRGWSGKTMRLTIEFRPGQFIRHTFVSKAWTANHEAVALEDRADMVPPHTASFTPGDVRAVVTMLEFHKGELPDVFETTGWKLTA